jgi:hypothetical protein
MSIDHPKTNFSLTSLVVLLLSVAAFGQKVTYDVVQGTDFSKYKTYKWQRAEKASYPAGGSDEIIMRSIDAQLAAKGLTRSEAGPVDLYVTYQLAIVENAEWSSFSNEIQWEGGANSLAGFRGATTNSTMMIRKGWMIVDVYDVDQKKYVWHATASKTLGDSTDPKKIEKNARKAMAKVFENFPRGS